jgi:hypothetical protein
MMCEALRLRASVVREASMSGAAPFWYAHAGERVALEDLASSRISTHPISDPAIWSGDRRRHAGGVSGRFR